MAPGSWALKRCGNRFRSAVPPPAPGASIRPAKRIPTLCPRLRNPPGGGCRPFITTRQLRIMLCDMLGGPIHNIACSNFVRRAFASVVDGVIQPYGEGMDGMSGNPPSSEGSEFTEPFQVLRPGAVAVWYRGGFPRHPVEPPLSRSRAVISRVGITAAPYAGRRPSEWFRRSDSRVRRCTATAARIHRDGPGARGTVHRPPAPCGTPR